MIETINRNLLQYAVSTAIFCPYCQHVLDMREAVLVSHAGGEFLHCATCFDRVAEGLRRHGVDVLDGRELFPRRKAAARKPRPTPGTPQERRERIVAALTAYDRRQQALSARNPRRAYNPNALALYFQALDRAEHAILEQAKPVKQALTETFTGSLLTAVLRAIGEAA